MIQRKEYLENLIRFKDKELIKVVVGIRRCGKSTLFDIYQDYLKSVGIADEQIISINLEDGAYMAVDGPSQLYDLVISKLNVKKKSYIFLDEVQRVTDFQKAVDSLFVMKNCDVYITGSNALLLSGELATLLAGRYIEIKMLPLSFKEYVSAFPNDNNFENLYLDYTKNSSFPYALTFEDSQERLQYLQGIYDTIVLKDIVARRKISNVEMLRSIVNFMIDNIGNISSTKSIADTMTSAGRKISVNTVEKYLSAFTDSFIFYKTTRFDIKGKQYLRTGDKYYIADVGMRYSLLGNKETDLGHTLENVVFLELIRRGYTVYIGKLGKQEIDFVALKNNIIEYYQVAYSALDTDGRLLDREVKPLDSIKDHHPKFLLTMDLIPYTSHNGIHQINAIDWLLGRY